MLSEKKRGRPKKEETQITFTSPLGLAEAAYEAFCSEVECTTPMTAYSMAGSVFPFASHPPLQLMRMLLEKKQIQFSGIPEKGDLVFYMEHEVMQVALIDRFLPRENKLFILVKTQGGCEVVPLKSWHCFGKILS